MTASAVEWSPGTMSELIRVLKSEVMPSTDNDALGTTPTQLTSVWVIALAALVAMSWFA